MMFCNDVTKMVRKRSWWSCNTRVFLLIQWMRQLTSARVCRQ